MIPKSTDAQIPYIQRRRAVDRLTVHTVTPFLVGLRFAEVIDVESISRKEFSSTLLRMFVTNDY